MAVLGTDRGQPSSTGVGVFARQPFLGIDINANRIFGELGGTDATVDWRAILVGDQLRDPSDDGGLGRVATGFVSSLHDRTSTSEVYFSAAGSTWRASESALAVLLPSVSGQITITANQTRAAMLLSGAMVSVFDPVTRGITLSNNQVDLDASGFCAA